MGDVSWNIMLVPEGYRWIKIKYADGRGDEQGTYPAGHMRYLT
ncbi:hypothetical protein LCGC14_3155710, partial [marine sediment metagenome]